MEEGSDRGFKLNFLVRICDLISADFNLDSFLDQLDSCYSEIELYERRNKIPVIHELEKQSEIGEPEN